MFLLQISIWFTLQKSEQYENFEDKDVEILIKRPLQVFFDALVIR